MPKQKPRKRLRPRGFFGRWKWVLIPVLVLLLIPAMQVVVVRFVNPPRTLPMWIEQASASGVKAPLRYRWIPLAQIPEMFLEHLWISEDQDSSSTRGLIGASESRSQVWLKLKGKAEAAFLTRGTGGGQGSHGYL